MERHGTIAVAFVMMNRNTIQFSNFFRFGWGDYVCIAMSGVFILKKEKEHWLRGQSLFKYKDFELISKISIHVYKLQDVL